MFLAGDVVEKRLHPRVDARVDDRLEIGKGLPVDGGRAEHDPRECLPVDVCRVEGLASRDQLRAEPFDEKPTNVRVLEDLVGDPVGIDDPGAVLC